MIVLSKHISLFRQIDSELLKQLKITMERPSLTYEDEQGEEVIIELPQEHESEWLINEYNSMWYPTGHNLQLNQSFMIENVSVLFGKDGVTALENKLGFAVHIFSKTSNFQKTIDITELSATDRQREIEFQTNFKKNSIRGTIFLQYFIYLKEVNSQLPFQANSVGMKLLDESEFGYAIIADGNGSEFPIEEISEDNGPLWRVEMNWTDIYIDLFDRSNVRLLLNKKHELYEKLYGTHYKVDQYLLNEILINAMVMITQKIVLIEGETVDQFEDATPGSIAQAVWYWVTTFDIQLDSLESISTSFHQALDIYVS
ncbi:hypothetical protein BWX42_06825 [Dolosigranulum pigrum]|uniref:Uncharacterized protein n=1 Tax=Dolosigranulum pigrum TaxID=29394 RepID=A0A1S8KP41_9LACT|nr:hypothetical protein BWX42_06825 [Dolosigranulum pigrum]